MKKNLPFIFFFFILTISLKAQIVAFSEVPKEVLESFRSSFTNATEQEWAKFEEFYSVTFQIQNTLQVHIVYDQNGEVIEKYIALPKNDAPSAMRAFVKLNYPDMVVKNYWVKQKNGERIFKVEMAGSIYGGGSISGAAGGNDNNLNTNSSNNAAISATHYQVDNSSQVLYFDKSGRSITKEEGISGIFTVAKVELDNEQNLSAQNEPIKKGRRK